MPDVDDALTVVPLLDDTTQREMRAALGRSGLDGFDGLRDETLAALAVLGRHPQTLRSATLSLISFGVRAELRSARLAEPRGKTRQWDLTPAGVDVATVLAGAVSDSDRASSEEARVELERVRAQITRDLGPLG